MFILSSFLSCLYILCDVSNYFFLVFLIAGMDYLRNMSAVFRDGDLIQRSLAETVDAILDTISQANDALSIISSYKERK